jgi:hypothetical protein
MAYFQNHQWAVTEWGLEALTSRGVPEYPIAASRLLVANGIGWGMYYDWPLQLAAKTWIDIGAFNEAYRVALEYHKGKYRGEVDQAMLAASLCYAVVQARRTANRCG